MKHTPTQLERIFAADEGITTPDIIFADIDKALDVEKQKEEVERSILRRVEAMVRYVYGVCQAKEDKLEAAKKATAPLEHIASQRVAEFAGDPVELMTEFALNEVFDPTVAEVLYTMEEALHENKDKTKPAGQKATLRDLMQRRADLNRMAA